MRCAICAAVVFVALVTGCVPVTEPLSDIEKAEPDKDLVGSWADGGAKPENLVIDVPAVKGNPKGLMQGSNRENKKEAPIWFFVTKVGKHRYANIIVNPDMEPVCWQFDKEGAFAKWQKTAPKPFFIFLYTIDGDKLTIDPGSETAVQRVMGAEKIPDAGKKLEGFYATPAGWLAKYLDKNGPDALFGDARKITYTRVKK